MEMPILVADPSAGSHFCMSCPLIPLKRAHPVPRDASWLSLLQVAPLGSVRHASLPLECCQRAPDLLQEVGGVVMEELMRGGQET